MSTIKFKLKNPNIKYLISGIYRPPNSNIIDFTEMFTNKFENYISDYVICIGGEVNINFLNYNDSNNTKYFYDSIYSLNLYPTITKPTRITSTNSLIDNLFTNFQDTLISGIVYSDISDHLQIFINFKIASKRYNIIIIKKSRTLKENNIYKFKLAITNFNWNLLKYDTEMCINDTFTIFVKYISMLYNKTCSLITNKLSKKHFRNKPWIWNTIRKCIFKKNKLYKRYIKNKTVLNKLSYTSYTNILTKILRYVENKYYNDKSRTHSNNSKQV